MKTLFLAALCCIMGTIAANAQWFANYTACDVTIRQVCLTKNCVATPGATVTVTAGNIIPVPFTPCTAPQETTYEVCWANCPATCVTVTVSSTTPYACPVPLPYETPLPGGCGNCNGGLVSADPSGTVKIFP